MAFIWELMIAFGGSPVAGAVGYEFLNSWVDERGRPYREVAAQTLLHLAPVLGSREMAEGIVSAAPFLAIPVAMAIRISIKELAHVLFGKKFNDLSAAEQSALRTEIDHMVYDKQKGIPSYRDIGACQGPGTKLKGMMGEEKHLEPAGVTRLAKDQRGKTLRSIQPHIHDEEGKHLPM